MLLLSWNVAGRVRRLDEQAERVVAQAVDVVCLQEVTLTTAPTWCERLADAGLSYTRVAPAEAALAAGRARPLLTLTAAREPLQDVAVAGVPWPERVLAVALAGLELINLHSPISPSPELAKVRTHEALHEHLAAGDGPRVLCGDLNTPRREHPDGSVWTFARDRNGHLRPERGERWELAELALIKGLEQHGFRDAFRELHGTEVREISWAWRRFGGGYRLDHLIVSPEVSVVAVSYIHDWRHEGLSDHSALLAWIQC
jgi:exonuclease III